MLHRFLRIGLSLILIFLALTVSLAFSQNSDELSQQYQEKQKQIQDLNQKIEENKGQQKTLSNIISLLNNQIALKELEIEQTEYELKKLATEILALDINLTQISKLLVIRVGESYKSSLLNPGYYFFASSRFSEFLEKSRYLAEAQKNDRKILFDLQNNKDDKETKQEELNRLEARLESQKADLAEQKTGKQELLTITKNDEKRFQDLLTTLQADLSSITNALAGGGVKIGKVTTSDVIGVVGSSGCSTGSHLHFEVFTNVKVENGALISKSRVDPKPYLDGGQYKKPVPHYPGNVTTWYGEQYPESLQKYFGTAVHTGIDIANSFGTPIYPIADGTAYFVSGTCKNPPSGGTTLGKGILVDHENGLATLYWHIP